jgi:multiple sugar transport system permease protein
MPFRTFLGFILPSAVAMLLLIAIPLAGVIHLSLWNTYTKTRFVETEVRTPLGVRKDVRAVAETDAQGRPVQVREWYGARNYETVLGVGQLGEAAARDRSRAADGSETSAWQRLSGYFRDVVSIRFWGALEFTLLYTFVTTPLILAFGFLIALGVNSMTKALKGPLIFASLLPFIVTPVVGSLSIKWLFLDNAIITVWLEQLGFGKIYFLKDAFTTRALIILVGVWKATPFAFIVLYAGLQTVPSETREAAIIDGASRWEVTRYVTIPHLMPLFVFITLIYVMDAYRVFEPILVFSGGQGADSLQHQAYKILNDELNYHKASASSLLMVLGIVFLLIPLVIKTWRDQRRAFA